MKEIKSAYQYSLVVRQSQIFSFPSASPEHKYLYTRRKSAKDHIIENEP